MVLELTSEDEKKLRSRWFRVHELLREKYGRQTDKRTRDPLDELILTILGQNTSSPNAHAALESVKGRFRDWESLMTASIEEITPLIKAGGLNRVKALKIKRILKKIHKEHGKLSLDFLRDLDFKSAIRYLLSLNGVGSRTASRVLLFSLKKPVMPVNTHVERVTKRIGWIRASAGPEEIQELFNRVAPRYLIAGLYAQLVKHGQVVCKLKEPRCTCCAIRQDCDYYQHRAKRPHAREESIKK